MGSNDASTQTPTCNSATARHERYLRGGGTARLVAPLICFLCGILFAAVPATLLVPPGGTADEPSHIARVDQLSRGIILSQKVGYRSSGHTQQDALYGGQVDEALARQSNTAMIEFHTSDHQYAFPTWTDKKANLGLEYGRRTTSFVFSNSAVNSPIVYLPQLCGFLIARLFTHQAYWLIVAMRLGGLLCFLLLGLLALWRITSGRWLMAATLLLPGALLIFSGVTADLVTFCCVSLIFAEVVRAYDRRRLSTADLVILCCSIVLLGTVKTTYMPCLAFVVIPFLHREFRTKRTIISLSVSSNVSCLLFLIWFVAIHSINTGAMYSTEVNPREQMHYVFAHLPKTSLRVGAETLLNHSFFGTSELGIIGSRARATTLNGGTVVVLLLITACLYEAAQRRVLSRTDKVAAVIMAVVIVVCSLLVCLALYLTFTSVGAGGGIAGVQDRYYFPLIPAALLSLCWLLCGPVSKQAVAANGQPKEGILDDASAADEIRRAPIWAVVTSSALSIIFALFAVLTIFR